MTEPLLLFIHSIRPTFRRFRNVHAFCSILFCSDAFLGIIKLPTAQWTKRFSIRTPPRRRMESEDRQWGEAKEKVSVDAIFFLLVCGISKPKEAPSSSSTWCQYENGHVKRKRHYFCLRTICIFIPAKYIRIRYKENWLFFLAQGSFFRAIIFWYLWRMTK